MALIDIFNCTGKIGNVDFVIPSNTDTNAIVNALSHVLNTYNGLGITVPPHTVMVIPPEYSAQYERPYALFYPNCPQLIFLVPHNKPDELIFQYLHELCHHIVRNFPQETFWIAEMLCFTASLWFYPGQQFPEYANGLNSRFYLDFSTNKTNYQRIKHQLTSNSSAVYLADTPICSALWSYWNVNNSFDFVGLLKQYAAAKGDPEKQAPLNNYVIAILEGRA